LIGYKPVKSAIRKLVSAAYFASRGFPKYCYYGAGGIGDDLLCTTVFREWRKRSRRKTAVAAHHPELFRESPDIDIITHYSDLLNPHSNCHALTWKRLGYADYDVHLDKDVPPKEHIVKSICRAAGIKGSIELRPYLYLTTTELLATRRSQKHIIMQSTGLSAAHPMRNKDWYPERFKEVCRVLSEHHAVIQVGSASDPPLQSALDLRGKTTLRETAALLANAEVFVGLVGGLMHLARAVDCPSVIVYGGREHPDQTGYIANVNLYSPIECAPCWLRNDCCNEHKCMKAISSEEVVSAALEQIRNSPPKLPVETCSL
jgi:hypothetical protein